MKTFVIATKAEGAQWITKEGACQVRFFPITVATQFGSLGCAVWAALFVHPAIPRNTLPHPATPRDTPQ